MLDILIFFYNCIANNCLVLGQAGITGVDIPSISPSWYWMKGGDNLAPIYGFMLLHCGRGLWLMVMPRVRADDSCKPLKNLRFLKELLQRRTQIFH